MSADMNNFKENRIRNEKHRRFIATLPCCITGKSEVQCAHIRSGCHSMGMKPSDSLTLPLYWREHDRQHKIGELKFYAQYGGIEHAVSLALSLYENTGNREKCLELIRNFRCGMYL